jgi:hypothetical protein
MGLGTNNTTITTSDKWIPEQWEDDAIATYKTKTVMANLVKRMNHKGRKGDTFHIPSPGRGEASAKVANTQVTLVADTATEVLVYVDKWYEYSKLYEDMADIQSLNGMKSFYTEDAGYALAKRIDRELHKLGAGFNAGTVATATALYEKAVIGSDGSTNFSGSANTNTGNGAAITDAAIRRMIQTLEDSDVNSMELSLVLPPVESNVLRGISRFTEQAFVGEAGGNNVIRTGRLGNLYGVELFVSSNCPWIHVNSQTGTQSVTFSSTAPTGASYSDDFAIAVDWNTSSPTDTKYRAGMMFHKDSLVLVEQQGIRTQKQYKQEYLGYLVTTDCIFGTKELRDYGGLSIIVPA